MTRDIYDTVQSVHKHKHKHIKTNKTMRQFTLIELNGIYDIICAFCIYNPIIPIINDLHISLFRKELMTPLTKRIMAQWILLYGIIRLTHSYHKNPTLVTATYIIEGTTFLSEMIIYSTIDKTK